MTAPRSLIPVLVLALAIGGCAARHGGAGDAATSVTRETPVAATPSAPSPAGAAKTARVGTGEAGEKGMAEKLAGLSPASQLMVRACDNYVAINPGSPKAAEVLSLKGSVYYNHKLYDRSRGVYGTIVKDYAQAPEAVDAVRMMAQSYFEEKQFDRAEEWYRKLQEMPGEGTNKAEAMERIAAAIFRRAESLEAAEHYEEAAAQYERVALEFPDASIADVALLNGGLAYEKQAEWSRSILAYQRLRQRYPSSKHVPKSMFRSAKAYEKLMQWDEAAQMYLRLVAGHPSSDLASAALYNAGFCFENANKLVEAAATFEKLATAFPNSDDAADVLFRAGEIYGKLKDWPNVTRVNQEFSRRYGGDVDRVVQAMCMVGVALYMQGQQTEAVGQLENAVTTFRKLKEPSTVNRHYAAKAQFTIAEIHHERQNETKLILPKPMYRKLLKTKSAYLDQAVGAYSEVIRYGISEWTTRSIFQIGQAYEDFALGIFRQERPSTMPLDERIALELGIAQALEEYFVDRALPYHEQNVKLGIKEKVEDKHVLNSRSKLTYLPTTAGENYLKLSEVATQVQGDGALDGFALIAKKLSTLQKVGPFEERAIALFLRSLELGTRYQEYNEFYKSASERVTRTSFTVGETYADIARIAREAPVPETFDPYERYVYKTKLLKQIEGYEENSLTNYLKTLKIADAYGISDAFVAQARERIPQLLFVRGRSYDLLCISAFTNPPFPADVSDEEKDEYQARFEEIGLRFQEQAFEVYRAIVDYAAKNYAVGEYVNHAYVRLYQNFPDEFGVAREKIAEKTIVAGPQWKCAATAPGGWESLSFEDKAWGTVGRATLPDSLALSGFPGDKVPPAMWYIADGQPARQALFRREFFVTDPPHTADLYMAVSDSVTVFLNEEPLFIDTVQSKRPWTTARHWDLKGALRQGKNVLAIDAVSRSGTVHAALPLLTVSVTTEERLPLFPGTDVPIDRGIVSEDNWEFPPIKNFSLEPVAASGGPR